ncbi:hypothetical protein PR048_012048 [Dryococelus australis]|uniref:Uncharacterized protein n=1 Tax=Dryococelus australis TaxID=614101 RepID=A0ABQ9HNC4_9NEOP|nr:hypothetical protein PR048_012048 [Dryococelus australis]
MYTPTNSVALVKYTGAKPIQEINALIVKEDAANRVRSPAGSLRESCRIMPLVNGFSRGSPIYRAPSFRRCSVLTSNTLIGSQDLTLKSCSNLFTLFTQSAAYIASHIPNTPNDAAALSACLQGRNRAVCDYGTSGSDPVGDLTRSAMVGGEQVNRSATEAHWSGEIWVVLNIEVLRVGEGEIRSVWGRAGMQGRGKREIAEKACRPAASYGTNPTCENPRTNQVRLVDFKKHLWTVNYQQYTVGHQSLPGLSLRREICSRILTCRAWSRGTGRVTGDGLVTSEAGGRSEVPPRGSLTHLRPCEGGRDQASESCVRSGWTEPSGDSHLDPGNWTRGAWSWRQHRSHCGHVEPVIAADNRLRSSSELTTIMRSTITPSRFSARLYDGNRITG